MSAAVDAVGARKARRIPIRHTLPRLARNPLGGLETIAREADGEVVRVDLGWFRPYLVTNPDHVQHVLRDNVDNYVRDGQDLFWRPIRRLLGEGILADGPVWEASRRNLQPLFTAKRIESLVDGMADAIVAAVDDLERHARDHITIDVAAEMSRIVHLTIVRVFFDDRIKLEQAERLVTALDTIATSITVRLALPFVPNAVPLPGDGAFRRAVRVIDEIVFPIVRECRRDPREGTDIVATLCRSRGVEGEPLTEQQVRDDVVSVFGAAIETTVVLLTWLWPVLQAHTQVAARLYAEVDRVVGAGRVRREHLPGLRYTRMVLDELLRLYPPGWLFPRKALRADVIGGVRIKPGGTLLISPYLTQRLEPYWSGPLDFRPERFEPGAAERHHRYAYFPFGGGPHQCIGKHVFLVEAQLVVAAMLSRFRPRLASTGIPAPQVAASLRPATEVRMTLLPVERKRAA